MVGNRLKCGIRYPEMGMDTRAVFFCYDVPTSFVREIFYDRGNCPLFGAVEFKVSE